MLAKAQQSAAEKLERAKRLFPQTAEAVLHDSQGSTAPPAVRSIRVNSEQDGDVDDDQDAALRKLIQKGIQMDPEFANRMLGTVEQYAQIVRQRNIVATGIYAVPASTMMAQQSVRAEHDRHWMDLFFDLIYVAAAFQLGVLLNDILLQFQTQDYSLVGPGALIWASTFMSVFHTWQQKLDFMTRFSSPDLFHRVWDIVEACIVACLAVNLPDTVVEFTDQSTNALWMFTLFRLLYQAVSIGRWIEIRVLSRTSFTLEHALATSAGMALTGIAGPVVGTVASMAGTIILSPLSDTSAKAIHQQSRSTASFFLLAQITGFIFQSVAFALSFSEQSGLYTICALLISSVAVENLLFLLRIVLPLSDLVPIDVKYAVHRFGEWTMLILGEGVLGMILVKADSFWLHFATFIPGFVVLVMLQIMYYSSQPHHYEGHALYRDKHRGFFWFVLQPLLSGVIILVDVSLKLVLTYQATIPSSQTAVFVWLVCSSLCLLLLMIMFSQILHNGFHEEFIEFSRNSPFAAIMKFGLWGSRIVGALVLLLIPLIPSLPAWAVLIICAILTISQVVMHVMMTLLNDSFSVTAIRADMQKMQELTKTEHQVDMRKMNQEHHRQQTGGSEAPQVDIETPDSSSMSTQMPEPIKRDLVPEPSVRIQDTDSSARTHMPTPMQREDEESPRVVIPPPTQRQGSRPKLNASSSFAKRQAENDLAKFISDPLNMSSAEIQRLFNIYGRDKLQEMLLQGAESVAPETVSRATNAAKTAKNVVQTAQNVAQTAQNVAQTASKFANAFS